MQIKYAKSTIMNQFFLAIAVLFFCSCKKSANCDPPAITEITTNSPVVTGWPLYMSTMQSLEYTYHWKGPNGFSIEYDYFSSTANEQSIDSAILANGGIYEVELKDRQGCVAYKGTMNVEVTAPPLPPCNNMDNNTSISSILGIAGVTYNDIRIDTTGGRYTFEAKFANEVIVLRFNEGGRPKPGIYKATGNNFESEKGTAGIHIKSGLHNLAMKEGGKLYVNKVGSVLQFCFCQQEFFNPFSASQLLVSGKIIE